MSQHPNVLFPFNGHYFAFEGFVRQLENAVASARIYHDSDTAKVISTHKRKELLRAVGEHLSRRGE